MKTAEKNPIGCMCETIPTGIAIKNHNNPYNSRLIADGIDGMRRDRNGIEPCPIPGRDGTHFYRSVPFIPETVPIVKNTSIQQATPTSLAKSFSLRPYQQTIIDQSIDHFRKTPDPIIIDACVGSGKTLIISHIARHVIQKGGRVISLAHTKELVESAHETFTRYAPDIKHDVVFCSEKSLVNALDKFQPIDLLIMGEFKQTTELFHRILSSDKA